MPQLLVPEHCICSVVCCHEFVEKMQNSCYCFFVFIFFCQRQFKYVKVPLQLHS